MNLGKVLSGLVLYCINDMQQCLWVDLAAGIELGTPCFAKYTAVLLMLKGHTKQAEATRSLMSLLFGAILTSISAH